GFRAAHYPSPGGSAPGVCTPGAANPAPAPAGTYEAATGPMLEPLEGRRLLSSVSLSGGVLQVTGDANVANHLVVQPSGSSNLFVYANNANKTVARSAVKSVRFTGGNKDDVIFLASTLPIDAVVNAGAGNDDIRLGAGNDWFRAHDGNDTLLGGAGDDAMSGGTGSDYFDGGAGKNIYSDLKAEDKVPYGSSYGTPGGGNGDSGNDGVVPVGITDNETI